MWALIPGSLRCAELLFEHLVRLRFLSYLKAFLISVRIIDPAGGLGIKRFQLLQLIVSMGHVLAFLLPSRLVAWFRAQSSNPPWLQ